MESQNKSNGGPSTWVNTLMTICTGLLLTGIYQLFAMSNNIIIIKEQAYANKEILMEHGKKIDKQDNINSALLRRIDQLEFKVNSLEDWRNRQNSK